MRRRRIGPEVRAIALAVAGAVLAAGCGVIPGLNDELTVEVRNESGRAVELEIVDTNDAAGQEEVLGAPIPLEEGEVRDVTFSAPTSDWGVRVRGGGEGYHHARDLRDWLRQVEEGDIATLYLVVNPDGNIHAITEHSEEVPAEES